MARAGPAQASEMDEGASRVELCKPVALGEERAHPWAKLWILHQQLELVLAKRSISDPGLSEHTVGLSDAGQHLELCAELRAQSYSVP